MKRLVVALDDSEISLKVIDTASELAVKFEAQLYLIHVIQEERLTTKPIWKQVQDAYQLLATEIG